MNNQDILISVVIPTYSRNATLKNAIESVLAQTYQNFEILVVDDNLPDSEWRKSTQALMKEYEENPKIRYIQNVQNLGGAGARNEGIKAAKGEYIAFLDDDDEYLPQKLEKQLDCFLTTDLKRLALVFCDAVILHDNDVRMGYKKTRVRGNCLYEAIQANCLAATSQWLAKKSALAEVGGFTLVSCKQDATLILKCLGNGFEIDYVPELLVKNYYRSDLHISGDGLKNLNGELAYKRRCEEYYNRFSKKQIDEIEYSFATILYRLYKMNSKIKEAKNCKKLMLRIHPIKTIFRDFINVLRRIKYSIKS